ncbi:hypothetical protein HY623_03740 [Candidatus Uhrbacteria bacterium]|nr:hypothetical protein [Candidatus Uhrbacteria bacterium]
MGRITPLIIGGLTLATLLIAFPFARDMAYNEIKLISLKKRMRAYQHPVDSQLVRELSLIGNLAPASNQCGFVVAQVRTTTRAPDDVRAFYAPVIIDSSGAEPPYQTVSLFMIPDEESSERIDISYSEISEQIIKEKLVGAGTYLFMISETGYPPNNDPRCH